LDGSGFFRLELIIEKEQPTNRSCPSPFSFERIERMNLKLMIESLGATIFGIIDIDLPRSCGEGVKVESLYRT
jgi:hypothetical protein